jgi:hydroxymethylbilane synthase
MPMAGNVDSRLRRLEEGEADALILACAGLERLDRAGAITRRLDVTEFLPAPGQGALGLVCREGDEETKSALATQEDPEARATSAAERGLLNALRGGCRAPIGTHAAFDASGLSLTGRVLSLDGRETIEATSRVERDGVVTVVGLDGGVADGLGRRLAEELLARGAGRLVDAARLALP